MLASPAVDDEGLAAPGVPGSADGVLGAGALGGGVLGGGLGSGALGGAVPGGGVAGIQLTAAEPVAPWMSGATHLAAPDAARAAATVATSEVPPSTPASRHWLPVTTETTMLAVEAPARSGDSAYTR